MGVFPAGPSSHNGPMSPTLFLMVGLPGAGKTTRARVVAAEQRAVRLTPDEWMIPLFGESDAGGKRDVLEGRLISLAVDVLGRGVSVILDFGCWSRAERSALRSVAARCGAAFRIIYLPIDPTNQLDRVAGRWATTPGQTFPMTPTDLDRWAGMFQAPDERELAGLEDDPPPAPFGDWVDWARSRWPSLSVDTPAATAPAPPDRPEEVVRRHLEAFGRGDLDDMLSTLAPDATFRTGSTLVPPNEFAEFLGWAMRELHPAMRIESLLTDADRVACRFIETIDGRDLYRAAFFRVHDGLITSADVYDRAEDLEVTTEPGG